MFINRQLIKDKTKAFTTHFLISLAIILAFIGLAVYYWYAPNMLILGATHGLIILVLVDLVLGPFLTFVVFKKGKRSLPFDLTVIFTIQIACFVYGAKLIIDERPLLQVIADNGLTLFTKSELSELEGKNHGITEPNTLFYLTLEGDLTQTVAKRAIIELTTGKPFAYQPNNFLKASNISQQQFTDRMAFIQQFIPEYQKKLYEKLSKENSKECEIVPITSKHKSNAYACISYDQGVIFVDEH